MAWLSERECLVLLREAGCAAALIAHTQKVAEVARPIAVRISGRGHRVDLGLVHAGALLHDIGRAKAHDIRHALRGADLLRKEGLPEPLCLIVERHTGAGIDPEEARVLGLPVRDYTPVTLEEKIVCQADNLVDGARRQKVQDETASLRTRGLDRVAVKVERLHRELSELAGADLDTIE